MNNPSEDGEFLLATAKDGVFEDWGRSYFDGGSFGFGSSLFRRRFVRILDEGARTRTLWWHNGDGGRKIENHT